MLAIEASRLPQTTVTDAMLARSTRMTSPLLSRRHTWVGRAPRRGAFAALFVLSALMVAGCGDDAESEGAAEGGADDVVSTTNPAPSGAQPIPDLPTNTDPSAVECTGDPQGVFDATRVVGKPVTTAKQAAQAEGCQIRVAMEDGKGLALTQDFRPDRVNVAVEDGDVTEIIDIG